jgi:curli biogenesis system outer membrane secretion channel CsgG
MRRVHHLVIATATALALAGCAAPVRLYVNPQADMTRYDRVAVMAFANLSQQPFAGDRVTRMFVTELILASRYQVVEPAEFGGLLYRMGFEPASDGNYEPRALVQAADSLHATGVIRGAVTEYGFQRFGQDDVPVIAFDVELRDAATGDVVWRVSISRRGKGRLSVFGSGGTRSFGSLTQEACVRAVLELKRKAL